MPFTKLGLYSSLVRGAQALGYVEPTPIQAQGIPIVLAGRDLVASAPTGTGKTAAFALPVLNRLGPHRTEGPRVLVLEPTRELSVQIGTAFRDLGRFTDLRTIVLHGGVDYGPQRNALRAGADIVIATVGRLTEFLDNRVLRLDRVEVLILDEVDRMLDLGFIDELDLIKALGRNLGVPFIDLTATPVDTDVADVIPDRLARRYGAVPVKFLDDQVLLDRARSLLSAGCWRSGEESTDLVTACGSGRSSLMAPSWYARSAVT